MRYDAKGLLIQAIRDDDPVIFFEHKALYPRKGEVPEEPYTVPFGEASLVREGEHVTVVAFARMVPFAERAIDALAKEGITCDLIDPRTTSPLDEETIIESVEGTGRLVVVDESPPRCGMAADIAAIVAEKAFGSLQAAHHPGDCRRTRPCPSLPRWSAPMFPDPQRSKRPSVKRCGRHDGCAHHRRDHAEVGHRNDRGHHHRLACFRGPAGGAGREILDVETEKIVNAVEAPAAGVLRRILAWKGETQAVGALIGVIADEPASEADIAAFVNGFVAAVVAFDEAAAATGNAAPAATASAAAGGAAAAATEPMSGTADEARVSPIARRIAERLRVDLSLVKGTGRNGRISKEDVEGFAAQRARYHRRGWRRRGGGAGA